MQRQTHIISRNSISAEEMTVIVKAARGTHENGNSEARDKSMHGAKVGMDIDGTLALTADAIMKDYNIRTKSNYSANDITGWDSWGMPMPLDEFLHMHDVFWTTRWKEIKPAIKRELFAELADSCELEIITHRPLSHQEHLEAWLDMHFHGIRIPVKCVDSAEKKIHSGKDVLFDDGNPVAEELIRNKGNGPLLYLIDQPWNRNEAYHERSSRIIKVNSLEQGIREFLETNAAMKNNRIRIR